MLVESNYEKRSLDESIEKKYYEKQHSIYYYFKYGVVERTDFEQTFISDPSKTQAYSHFYAYERI